MTRRHACGFTLIEVLLATILLAAGLALAFATLRAATATAQRGEAIAQRNEHMRAVELFLRRRIGNARPIAFGMNTDTGMPRRFEGDREHMRFVADLPDYLGRGGPYLHDISVTGERGHAGLQVVFRQVQNSAAIDESAAGKPEVLAEGLANVQFRYRALDDQGVLGEWQDEWKESDRLPLQVSVRVAQAGGAAWPELVIALPAASGGAAPGSESLD